MHPNSSSEPQPQIRLVPDIERMGFLPRLFGPSLMITGENVVYTFMARMCADYRGGFWDFIEAGDALYMAPQSPERFALLWDGNGYQGVVSKDCAGIIVTLFALSHMSMIYRNRDGLAEAYDRLLEHASRHPEAVEIFRAID